jgi:AcrR family transcriptional regulator
MSEKTPDRRALKTRKAIRDALAKLLTEKELHKVTVQEITEMAEINRGTFYKHYLDIYDLYDKTENDILVDLGLMVLELEKLSSDQFFKKLIAYIDDNRTVFTMIFSPNTTGKLREKFTKCIEGLFRQLQAEKQHADIKDVTLSYRTCYRAQGAISIISKWVIDGFNESQDFIVATIAELDQNTEKIITSKK